MLQAVMHIHAGQILQYAGRQVVAVLRFLRRSGEYAYHLAMRIPEPKRNRNAGVLHTEALAAGLSFAFTAFPLAHSFHRRRRGFTSYKELHPVEGQTFPLNDRSTQKTVNADSGRATSFASCATRLRQRACKRRNT